MCCKRKTQNQYQSYCPPGQTYGPRRGCCGRRNYRDENFQGAPGLFGVIARRFIQKRNERNAALEQGQKNFESQTHGVAGPVSYEKAVDEKAWFEMDGALDMTEKKGTNEVLVEQPVKEGIGRGRVAETLGAGRRYESVYAPPKYEEAVMKD
jgi:hypothetical protein